MEYDGRKVETAKIYDAVDLFRLEPVERLILSLCKTSPLEAVLALTTTTEVVEDSPMAHYRFRGGQGDVTVSYSDLYSIEYQLMHTRLELHLAGKSVPRDALFMHQETGKPVTSDSLLIDVAKANADRENVRLG